MGLDFLLEFEIVVNAHLVEFMTEFDNYAWAVDKVGKPLNKPCDDFNHFIDSQKFRFRCIVHVALHFGFSVLVHLAVSSQSQTK